MQFTNNKDNKIKQKKWKPFPTGKTGQMQHCIDNIKLTFLCIKKIYINCIYISYFMPNQSLLNSWNLLLSVSFLI